MAPGVKKSACTGCSRLKLKCEDVPGHSSCKKCAAKKRPCERPAPGQGRCKKACTPCRHARTRCDRDSQGGDCQRCIELDIPCSFGQGPTANEPQAGKHACPGLEPMVTPETMTGDYMLEAAAGPSFSQSETRLTLTTDDEAGGVVASAPAFKLSVDVDLAAADDTVSGPTSTSSTQNSPNSNWWAVCVVPSPDA
ncbi:hypothetical protein C8T65DRAFT_200549 [Cerioporus squamosus]|nr:hypothetical protein C8T65DRAFT_200549 [Cerioporus squamosus]